MNLLPEEYAALITFAKKHGREWKYKLNILWQTGKDDDPLLRRIRNTLGPEWLYGFELRTYRLQQIQIVADHYIIAAIWADAPEGTRPRVTAATKKEAFRQCEKFIADSGELFDAAMANPDYGWHHGKRNPEAQFGHDLWLTRTGAGCGFWDREPLLEDGVGAELTLLCKKFGEPNYQFGGGWFHLYKEWGK